MKVKSRAGMALVLVMVLLLLSGFAFGVYFWLVSGETDRTAAQSKEIQAAALGEGVAARIAALVNQWPWRDRFYQKLAPGAPAFIFTQATFPFFLAGRDYKSGDIAFLGSIHDLAQPLNYRIRLEVVYFGQRVHMTFDKVYSTSVLSVADADGAKAVRHNEGGSQDALDTLLEQIKIAARDARPGVPPAEAATVDTAIITRRSGANPARQYLGLK